jgi:acetylornithine deacetylase
VLTATEAAAVEAVNAEEVTTTLLELMAVPSISGSPAEADIQHDLSGRLDRLGLDVDLWPLDLPSLRREPDYPGEEVERTEAYGLVGTCGPADPCLVLQAHVDVVPPGDPAAWRSAPFAPTITGDAIVGRGSCDMKAGLAAILGAVAAVRRAGASPRSGFAVHCVVGEEDGGIGAFGTLARGHLGAGCVIPEPTGLDLVTANAGALTFRIEVPGLATHGSTAYHGSSAIDSYLAIHRALAELQTRRNHAPEPLMRALSVPYPLSVGRLQAGDWPSSVPDRLVADGRYGLRVEEDPGSARAELEAAVQEVAARDPFLRDHPPVVSWPGGQFGGGRLAEGHRLRNLVGDAHADLTRSAGPPERGAPYGSDLRLYAQAGVPTLHYGPGDVRLAHGPNESVPLAQVLTSARVLVLALLRAEPG